MTNEISPERLIKFLPRRAWGQTRVISGPLNGLTGRAFQLGRDGRLLLRTPQPEVSELWITIDVDWLDTDLASRAERAAYRARRIVFRAPQRALSIWCGLLPARIVTEDLGDFIEQICRAYDAGDYFRAYIVAGQAMYWTAVNSIRFLLSSA
jgi:hypothetical protein